MTAETEPLSWGVVANVREPGLKHFRAGQKLWVNWVTRGDGGQMLYVVASHRGPGHRLIKIAIASNGLENFRVKAIWSPQIHSMDIHFHSREHADEFVAHMKKWASPFYVLERNSPFGERVLGACPTLDAALDYADGCAEPGKFRITQAPERFGRDGERTVVDYIEDAPF